MATSDEIQRRVEEADSARSARRSAAAQQVGELAQRRAAVAEQLDEIERELGNVLAAAEDVIGVDELARFTDLPAADLTRWLTNRKSPRAKKKRPVAEGAHGDASRASSAAGARQSSSVPEPIRPRAGAADTAAPVPAEVA